MSLHQGRRIGQPRYQEVPIPTCFRLVSCSDYFSVLKLKVACSSEASVDFERRKNPLFTQHVQCKYFLTYVLLWDISWNWIPAYKHLGKSRVSVIGNTALCCGSVRLKSRSRYQLSGEILGGFPQFRQANGGITQNRACSSPPLLFKFLCFSEEAGNFHCTRTKLN
jgi:hypothetical protein